MEMLEGMRVVNLSTNLPGPVAAMRLRRLGASVTKIEPPQGDALALGSPEYYKSLCEGQTVLTLDLTTSEGKAALDSFLAQSDLLLTAFRPRALGRLGLDWATLQSRYPRLCHVAIVGYPPPHDNRPGHDLTFQAEAGLLTPPHLPKSLIAGFGAAERAVSMALALLLARERGGNAGVAQVPIFEAAEFFACPLTYGLTGKGPLGGLLPGYDIYAACDGYVAVAALEPHFLQKLVEATGVERVSRAELEQVFLTRSVAEWRTWAEQHDVPLAIVR
jgi:alpha-methylacyl-CoA racemase